MLVGKVGLLGKAFDSLCCEVREGKYRENDMAGGLEGVSARLGLDDKQMTETLESQLCACVSRS